MTAFHFARLVNCNGEEPPCETCRSCRKIHAMVHPDIVLLERDPQRKMILIEQVRRELTDQSAYKPFEGRFRVFIVNDAHLLNDQAQNALLKVLEEPGSGVIIVLVTSRPGDLLPTIISRCRHFKFHPLSQAQVEEVLSHHVSPQQDPFRVKLTGIMAWGSPGRALKLWQDEQFWERRRSILTILDTLPDGSLGDVLAFSGSFKASYSDVELLESTFEVFLSWTRDLIVLQGGGGRESVINSDFIDSIRLGAQIYNPSDVTEFGNLILEIRRLVLNNNLNIRMALQRLLIHLLRASEA